MKLYHFNILNLVINQFNMILFSGDEIFSVNGRSVAGLTHSEAIGIFKETKIGTIQVTIGRREGKKIVQMDGDGRC